MATSPRLENNGFASNAGGAAFGNPRVSQAAAAAGATQAISSTSASAAPPNATAAPKGNTKDVFTGLAEALNTFQLRQVKDKKQDIADIYQFEFAPASLSNAKIKRQGTTNKKQTPMQDNKTAKSQKDPATNSVDTASRSIQVSAGTQIVQFIDQVMRTSTYITDQQLYIIDEETQETKPNPTPPSGVTAWYKISVEATPLGYDEKRHDHAYNMKFIISPYAINAAPSDWFKNSRYRGSHKSYNYWFTGMNKEILNFEQEYNNLYRLVISGQQVPVTKQARTDFRDQYRRTYLPTSENHAKGAEGYTNEAGDNLASFLYSPSDQGRVKLRIVGDPAWMQQGEISTGVSAKNFNFSPFNDDGTINYDSQEIVFDISWNQPQDYNFNTGLMDINRSQIKPDGTYSTQPQENFTYTAIKCKNIFSKGRFEQELEGRLLIEYETGNKSTASDGRPQSGDADAQDGGFYGNTRTSNSTTLSSSDWALANGTQNTQASVTADNEVDPQNDAAPTLTTTPAPTPATSNADIVTYSNEESDNNAVAGEVDNPISQFMDRES